MNNKEQINQIIESRGYSDYKWIIPYNDIVVAQWVRFKCQFGCNDYGKSGSCPPAVPSVEECRKMIYEYENAIILHFILQQQQTRDEKHKLMSELLELEREIFLTGNYKTFLLPHTECILCETCVSEGTREKCVNNAKCRPSTDAMAIDVFQTVRNAGYEIQVLKERTEIQNRFAIILIN